MANSDWQWLTVTDYDYDYDYDYDITDVTDDRDRDCDRDRDRDRDHDDFIKYLVCILLNVVKWKNGHLGEFLVGVAGLCGWWVSGQWVSR